MKNVLKAALVLGTLGTPMIALAGDPVAPPSADKAPIAAPKGVDGAPAKDAPAKDAKDAKAPKKGAEKSQVKAN